MRDVVLVFGWLAGAGSEERGLTGRGAVVADGEWAGVFDWGAETPIAVTARLPKAPVTMAIPVRFSGIKVLVG